MPRGTFPVLARRASPASRILPRGPHNCLQAATAPAPQPWLVQNPARGSLTGVIPARLAHSSTRPLILSSIQRDAGQGWVERPSTGFSGTTYGAGPRFIASFPPASSILSRSCGASQSGHTWQRNVHVDRRTQAVGIRRAHGSSKPPGPPQKPNDEKPKTTPEKGELGQQPNPTTPDNESIASSVSKYFHIPHIPHRPTKEELLAAANGFFERLKVRFKWTSIRSMRPWNADEWGAFVSWFILSHLVWILVGTTTFFSLLIFSINTVFAQGSLLLRHSVLIFFPDANTCLRNPGAMDW